MSLRILRQSVDALPAAVQRRVLDYGAFVNDVAAEIFHSAGVSEPTRRDIDRLVFVAGMRKLWSLVEFQRNTVNAMVGAWQYGIEGVVALGTYYTPDSREVLAINSLRDDLLEVFHRAEMVDLVQMDNLADVARLVRFDG